MKRLKYSQTIDAARQWSRMIQSNIEMKNAGRIEQMLRNIVLYSGMLFIMFFMAVGYVMAF